MAPGLAVSIRLTQSQMQLVYTTAAFRAGEIRGFDWTDPRLLPQVRENVVDLIQRRVLSEEKVSTGVGGGARVSNLRLTDFGRQIASQIDDTIRRNQLRIDMEALSRVYGGRVDALGDGRVDEGEGGSR